MLYIQVTNNVFHKAFHDMGRGNQFSYEALDALFDFYSEMAEDAEGVELDVIGICCDWTEYNNSEEAERDYGNPLEDMHHILLPSGGVLVLG